MPDLFLDFLFIKSKLDGNGSNWLKSKKTINNVYLWTWGFNLTILQLKKLALLEIPKSVIF